MNDKVCNGKELVIQLQDFKKEFCALMRKKYGIDVHSDDGKPMNCRRCPFLMSNDSNTTYYCEISIVTTAFLRAHKMEGNPYMDLIKKFTNYD